MDGRVAGLVPVDFGVGSHKGEGGEDGEGDHGVIKCIRSVWYLDKSGREDGGWATVARVERNGLGDEERGVVVGLKKVSKARGGM